MPRPLRIQYPGAFYHVTSRGNERKDVFKSSADREKFLGYLESATRRYGAIIHAYCLLSNHYHLLVETPRGNLSEIMRHINGAYTTYFNVKRQRSGHLFQGRYKAILVEVDAYAVELSRYIHLNPVCAGLVQSPRDYPWSSYSAYIGLRPTPDWLKTDFIFELLTTGSNNAPQRYREFVEAHLGQPGENPLDEAVGAAILGSASFLRDVVEKCDMGRARGEQFSALAAANRRPTLDTILDEVEKEWPRDPKLARKISLYLSHRLSGAPLKEIGARFGIKESAVAQASRRMACMLEADPRMADRITALEERISGADEDTFARHGRPHSGASEEESTRGAGSHLRERVAHLLKTFPEVRLATLFGSAVRGRLTAQSDLDIAVAADRKLSVEQRVRLAHSLAAALGREIDLIDLQDVSGLILEQALCRGEVILNEDTQLYARLLLRLWYNQADMMPYTRRILEERTRHWLQ